MSPPDTKEDSYLAYLHPAAGGEVGEPAYYRSLYFLEPLEPHTGTLQPMDGPLDPFDAKFDNMQAGLKPAVGVLTVHEQTWQQTGLALGNLLQSICLAPGEVTQLAVTRWQHGTSGRSVDDTAQAETVDSSAEQNRHVNEVQRAVANEAQWGGSSSFASATSTQAGAGCFFASASVANTTTGSLTAQHSGGNRTVAAEAANAISQSTAEKSQALRSRRQTVVREVSETEAEDLTTRVIANYNRRHSLNVLFFEVLQKYVVQTRLVDWERCLFVPFVPLDFEQPGVLERHQAQLLGLFRETGATAMIEHLNRALAQSAQDAKAIEAIAREREPLDLAQSLLGKCVSLQHALRSDQRMVVQFRTNAAFYQDKIRAGNLAPAMAAHLEERRQAMETALADSQSRLLDDQGQMEDVQAAWLKLPKELGLAPLTEVETVRAQIDTLQRRVQERIAEHRVPAGKIFNADRLVLSQQLWLRMSPHRVHRILQDYKLVLPQPAGGEPEERSVSSLVDPSPVGVFGSYVAFRWGFGAAPVRQGDGRSERESFRQTYLLRATALDGADAGSGTIVVGLPTSGLFAEAVMGTSVAAETSDSRFEKWGDKASRIPILPPKIADLQSRKANGLALTAADFTAPLAQLRAGALADVSHLDKVLGAVGKGDTFRDMGGLALAVGLSEKVAALSESGAKEVGDRIVDLQKQVMEKLTAIVNGPNGSAVLSELMAPGSGAALLAKKPDKDGAASPKALDKLATAKA